MTRAGMTANVLTGQLLVAIPKHFPTARVWRNSRLNAMAPGPDGKMRLYKAGIDGQADISGIIGVYLEGRSIGIRLEVEVKTRTDRQRTAQKAFQEMIQSRGGIYLISTDPEETIKDIGRIIDGLSRRRGIPMPSMPMSVPEVPECPLCFDEEGSYSCIRHHGRPK